MTQVLSDQIRSMKPLGQWKHKSNPFNALKSKDEKAESRNKLVLSVLLAMHNIEWINFHSRQITQITTKRNKIQISSMFWEYFGKDLLFL